MLNTKDFKIGEFIISVYTNKIYLVAEPDKSGMGTLINENGKTEQWNSHNNAHFKKFDNQLKLNV